MLKVQTINRLNCQNARAEIMIRAVMILGVLTFKGGQGKTTSSVHLTGFLNKRSSDERPSACLIDSDPNQSALTWARHGRLPFKVVDDNQTAKVARQFDHLIIDSKARPTPRDIESMQENCDLLILPVTHDSLSLEALMLTLEALGKMDKNRYRVLLTICPPYPSHDADDARRLITDAGLVVFSGQIRRAVAFQRAALAGVLVGEVADPRAEECAEDYNGIGREILKLVKQ